MSVVEVEAVACGSGEGVCAPPGDPSQIFEKIGPHSRLQDTKCSSIDMPPGKSGAPPSSPRKLDPSYATGTGSESTCSDPNGRLIYRPQRYSVKYFWSL